MNTQMQSHSPQNAGSRAVFFRARLTSQFRPLRLALAIALVTTSLTAAFTYSKPVQAGPLPDSSSPIYPLGHPQSLIVPQTNISNQIDLQNLNNINNNNYFDTQRPLMNAEGQLMGAAIGIDQAQWQQIADPISYSIDPTTLGLSVNYTYLFALRPSLRTADKEVPLPAGKYLLRIAVVLADSAAEQYSNYSGLNRNLLMTERLISWAQKVVTVRANGLITEQLTLPFRSVSSTVIANDIMFEITELEDNGSRYKKEKVVELSTKRPMILTGKFTPFQDFGVIFGDSHVSRIKPSPKKSSTLTRFISEAEKFRAYYEDKIPRYRSTVDAAQAFARQGNLKFITLNSPEILAENNTHFGQDGGKEALRDLLQTSDTNMFPIYKYPKAVVMLCSLLEHRLTYKPWTWPITDCMENPDKYMRIGKNIHVGAIDTNKISNLRGRISKAKYSVSGNFSINRSHSNDQFYSWNITSPIGMAIKLIELTGFISPVHNSYTINQSNSRSNAQSMSLNQNTNLDVNTVTLPIPVKRYLTCLTIQPREDNWLNDKQKKDSGFYLCNTREEQNLVALEDYVHAWEPWTPTSMIAYQTAAAQGPNFMMRGARDIVGFFFGLRSNLSADQDIRDTTSGAVRNAISFLEANRPAIPNVISVPVQMSDDAFQTRAGTMWEKILGMYEERFQVSND